MSVSKKYPKELHNILAGLKWQEHRLSSGKEINSPFGLCFWLTEILDGLSGGYCNHSAFDFIRENSQDWGFYSGDQAYPCPSRLEGVSASDYYNILINSQDEEQWKGDNRADRLSLTRHLIKKAEELLKIPG